MKMHVLSAGRLRMKKHVFVPEAGRAAFIDLPMSCFLLRHAEANVLFDTGCHPDVGVVPESRWGSLARAMAPSLGPGEGVLAQLRLLGLSPADIDIVVNSHLHCDHCGCNGFFTGATFLAHERELAFAADPAQEGKGYFRADWDHPMPVESFAEERDLFGDGRIVLIPLPGHSPGLTGALVALDRDGSFLLASDAVSLRGNLDHGTVPRNSWDAELTARSMEEIGRLERAGATVVCGHDAKQWAALRKGLEYYG